MKIVGLVLAGGQGRRMGGADKAFLPLVTRPLIAQVLARFAPQVDAVAISANGDPARFAVFGCAVLPDREPGFAGPLAGVLAGLDWALHQGAGALATVAVDTPFFPLDMVARLAEARPDGRVAMAQSAGRLHPTCALWPVGVQASLVAALSAGERRVARFAEAQGLVRVAFGKADQDPFFNINAFADLEVARLRLGAPG